MGFKRRDSAPPEIKPPEAERPSLKIDVPASGAPTAAPGGARVTVTTIQINGATVIPTTELQALVADGLGQQLDLYGLQLLADRITKEYLRQGYLLARAYLPAQAVDKVRVGITIQEGRLGAVRVENPDNLPSGPLNMLKPGQVLRGDGVEDVLLALADQLLFDALGSNEDLLYGRAAYDLPVGPYGTQAGVSVY